MNDVGAVVVCFIALVAIAATAFAFHASSVQRFNETFRRLARRFDGKSQDGGVFARPRVQFVHNNASVLIDTHPDNRKKSVGYTQFQIGWPDRHFRCEVYPDSLWARINKLIGMHDIEIGSSQFDRDYIITGNDVPTIRSVLSSEVQSRINQLKQFHQPDLYISVSGGRMMVKKFGYFPEYEMLERFVQMSIDLYDQAIQASLTGIDFVENKSVASLSLTEAACQICGEDVHREAVFCRSCKTPHHLDCWQYYGACSTYGCGEKRYLVLRKRRDHHSKA